MKSITKYDYKNFKRCPRLFALGWINPSVLKVPLGPAEEFRINQGKEVGLLAQKLFAGVEGVVFEKTFTAGNLFTRPDVLNLKTYELIEIKSSADIRVKSSSKKKLNAAPKLIEKFLWDVAFQKYVLDKAKVKIDAVKIGHINNKYTRDGDLDLRKLFEITDVTQEVEKELSQVKVDLLAMEKIIKGREIPEAVIGAHCFKCKDRYDNECPLRKDCLGEHLNDTIFNLHLDTGGKRFKLFNRGIHFIKDIPDDVELTEFRAKQKEAERTNCPVIDYQAIKKYVEKVNYPIYYLDFETFDTAVPVFSGIRPYQKIPFQVSIHVEEERGKALKHYSFLRSDYRDPRIDLVEFLVEKINKGGTIMVYNERFEKPHIRELANEVSHFRQELLDFANRIWDLWLIFDKGYYVHPGFKGSTSIKRVLPVLCSEEKNSYRDLDINKGDVTTLQYLKMIDPATPHDESDKIKNALLEYCEQDTYAMYAIFKKILELLDGKQC